MVVGTRGGRHEAGPFAIQPPAAPAAPLRTSWLRRRRGARRSVRELEAELEDLLQREKRVGRAPAFLHFDQAALDKVLPDLRKLEQDGELRLDPRGSLEVTLRFEKGAADFFREYAAGFIETAGKEILIRFADEEMRHCTNLTSRVEQLAPLQQPRGTAWQGKTPHGVAGKGAAGRLTRGHRPRVPLYCWRMSVIKQQPLSLLERLYVTEAAKGLALTARHFFANFPRHIARGLGFKVGKGGTVTYEKGIAKKSPFCHKSSAEQGEYASSRIRGHMQQ